MRKQFFNHIGITEHDIQTSIMNYLEAIGAYVVRVNSGMIPVGEGRYRRLIRMAKAGTPDILACYKGKFLGIEVKKPNNKPTQWQKEAQEVIKRAGGIAIIATSIDDVQKELGL